MDQDEKDLKELDNLGDALKEAATQAHNYKVKMTNALTKAYEDSNDSKNDRAILAGDIHSVYQVWMEAKAESKKLDEKY